MHGKYINRILQEQISAGLKAFPAVAILGPRQCGKSTLAQKIIEDSGETVYLELERPSDVQKLTEPELFLSQHRKKLDCLDEIQRMPDIFPILRSEIDADRTNGRFLILGSASPDLIRQSSESLAGRIAYFELTAFLYKEAATAFQNNVLPTYWLRGGFPDSFLAECETVSIQWRENFIRTFLERDVPQLGISIPAATLRRLWQICAHSSGQIFNASRLGVDIGVSHTTMKKYIDLVLERGQKRLAVECKASAAPQVSRGFWNAMDDLGIEKAWVIAPVEDSYPIAPDVMVTPLKDFRF